MRKRWQEGDAGWAALLSVFGLLLSACSGDGDGESVAGEEAEATAVPVEVARPVRGDIYQTYTGTAPIEAFADATVIAKVGGEIIEILSEEGEQVSKGQLLARLDGDRLRLELAESRAQLEKLKQEFTRNVELRDRSLISAGDFEKIQYEMEALEAAHELAALELSYTEIRAPIDGVISERFIKTGNTIDVNTPAFQVTSLEPLVAYLHVPEREYRRMRAGLEASISVDALPGTSFTGKIARSSPVVDPATGTFKLTIEVSDDTRRLKPGMFGRISIVSDKRENALRIPRNAIVESSGRPYVFVVSDGKAERRLVETGYVDGSSIEIRNGVTDGEQLVVVGQANLRDGASISIVETTSMMHATASSHAL
jgi:membrane fusion protein (multidrug efflux system)